MHIVRQTGNLNMIISKVCTILLPFLCFVFNTSFAMKRKVSDVPVPSSSTSAPQVSDDNKQIISTSKKFATICVHVGSEPDSVTGAVVPPISLATTFSQKGLGQLNGLNDVNSYGKGYEYSRTGKNTLTYILKLFDNVILSS